MRLLAATGLLVFLAACDASGPEAPTDASALVGTWGYERSEAIDEITSPVAQTLTNYHTVVDYEVTVSGYAIPPLAIESAAPLYDYYAGGFVVSLASAKGPGLSAGLRVYARDQGTQVLLDTYDPALEESGNPTRSYTIDVPASAFARTGGAYRLGPVAFTVDDGKTASIEVSLTFATVQMQAGEPLTVLGRRKSSDNPDGNLLPAYTLMQDLRYTYETHPGFFDGFYAINIESGNKTGTWAYSNGQIRFDDHYTSFGVRIDDSRLYIDNEEPVCTDVRCLQAIQNAYALETTPMAYKLRLTDVFKMGG